MLVKDCRPVLGEGSLESVSECQWISECQSTRLVVLKIRASFPLLKKACLHDVWAFTGLHTWFRPKPSALINQIKRKWLSLGLSIFFMNRNEKEKRYSNYFPHDHSVIFHTCILFSRLLSTSLLPDTSKGRYLRYCLSHKNHIKINVQLI